MSEQPSGRHDKLTVFVVAGEESGDQIGASLMDALDRRLGGQVTFVGVGGTKMAIRGLASLFPMEELSLHGFTQIATKLPNLIKRIRQTAAAAVRTNPSVMVLVDAPGFNLRVGKAVRKRDPGIPIVDYVSPTVWAWAPWRARRMAAYIDIVLAILPFEPDAHRRLGGPRCEYVGHPLTEATDRLRPAAGERTTITAAAPPVLLLLPGSRRSEVDRLLVPFGRTLALVAQRIGPLDVVLPAPDHLAQTIRARTAEWPVQPRIVIGQETKLAAFRSAHAALAASGTVSVELALAGVPMVIAYKLDPIVRLLKPFFLAESIVLSNLILGERVSPEYLDGEAKPQRLADALAPLFQDTPQRAAQLTAFARLDRVMEISGGSPSQRAADLVVACARATAPG